MTLKIKAKFEGKMTCSFKSDMMNCFHRLKNCDFILESKMAEVDQSQNSKQPDRQDAARKLYFTLNK